MGINAGNIPITGPCYWGRDRVKRIYLGAAELYCASDSTVIKDVRKRFAESSYMEVVPIGKNLDGNFYKSFTANIVITSEKPFSGKVSLHVDMRVGRPGENKTVFYGTAGTAKALENVVESTVTITVPDDIKPPSSGVLNCDLVYGIMFYNAGDYGSIDYQVTMELIEKC